nr:chorismate-binding protein [Sodalis glossinidius]
MNLSRASGTPGQRAISPPARPSFAWHCARVSDHHIWLYAVAGIVKGSDADQEWQEVENKAAGLQSLFTSETREQQTT